jgi:hypothetical protein
VGQPERASALGRQSHRRKGDTGLTAEPFAAHGDSALAIASRCVGDALAAPPDASFALNAPGPTQPRVKAGTGLMPLTAIRAPRFAI